MNQTGKKILAGVVLTVTMMVLLLSVTAFTAHAATGSCGKQCQWTLSGKTLTFVYKDYGSHSLISAVGPISSSDLSETQKQNITTVVIDDDIHAIQDNTFYGYKGITSVIIGKDVANIGKYAFYDCKSLENITIPNSVHTIGDKAFFLSGLKGVKLSDNLTSLGESAFRLTGLESITIPGKLRVVPTDCFYAAHMLKTVVLSPGVEEIGTGAFVNCDNLTKISIPSTVTKIGSAAFDTCKKLDSLDLSYVTAIGHLAVKGCTALARIRLSNALTDVDSLAFLNNYTAKKVIFDGTREEFEKIANKKESKNTDLLTGTVEYLQSSSDLPKVEDIEKRIKTLSGKAEVPGASFRTLRARAGKTYKKRIRLKWKAVPGATGYMIYGGERKAAMQRLETIKGGGTVSYSHKNLKSNKYYRYVVVAYQDVGSDVEDLRVLSCSPVIIAATLGGKFRNTQAVTFPSKKITLKKGKKQKLGAALVSKASVGKKYRTFLKMRYESSNPAVATVGRKGRIKAVNKGTCYVFAYAQDGIFKRIKVTVQ